jgi:hypothetical protein
VGHREPGACAAASVSHALPSHLPRSISFSFLAVWC